MWFDLPVGVKQRQGFLLVNEQLSIGSLQLSYLLFQPLQSAIQTSVWTEQFWIALANLLTSVDTICFSERCWQCLPKHIPVTKWQWTEQE